MNLRVGSSLGSYTFDPTLKTVTLAGLPALGLDQVNSIYNATRGVLLLKFNDPSFVGSIAGNVVTLNSSVSTTGMATTDDLVISVDYPMLDVDGGANSHVTNFPTTQAVTGSVDVTDDAARLLGVASLDAATLTALELIGVKGADGAAIASNANPLPVSDAGGSITVDGSVSVLPETYSVTSTTVSASGDTVLLTPTTGKAIRLHYVNYSGDGANSADVTAAVRFAAGALKYKESLKAGAIFARNIGAGRKYIQGAVNETLVVNLSAAQTVHVTVEHEEITP